MEPHWSLTGTSQAPHWSTTGVSQEPHRIQDGAPVGKQGAQPFCPLLLRSFERYFFDIRSCPLKGLLMAATATVTATAAARMLLLRLLSQAYYSHYHCYHASSCRTTRKILEFRANLGSRT